MSQLVESLTGDQRVASSRLTGVNAVSLSKALSAA